MYAANEGQGDKVAAMRRVVWLSIVVLVILAAGAVQAEGAQAAYEQAKIGSEPAHFGLHAEAEPLKGAQALAVNESGAGGVEAGSFYVVGRSSRVVRFSPGKEGEEPKFEEAWGWGIAKGGPNSGYVRCGPAYHGIANPLNGTYEQCLQAKGNNGGEEHGNFGILGGVAIDQTTGDVYVRNPNLVAEGKLVRAHHLIEVFTANGEPVGEGFGDSGDGTSSPPESIAEGPEKLHRPKAGQSPIAVDSSGTVYVLDSDYVGVENIQTRVMRFAPCTAGDYENYCYVLGGDITIQVPEAIQMSLIGSNRIVIASVERISEYPVQSGTPSPVCSKAISGQLISMAANASTGEIFYFRFLGHSIHSLNACDEGTGEFQEIPTKIELQPVPQSITGLAINASLAWGPTRPAGVLYAVDPENEIGYILVPPVASVPPAIEAETVTDTTASSTTFKGKINPNGNPVQFRFEYLSRAEYSANGSSFEGQSQPKRVPAVDGLLASGPPSTAAAAVSGLEPETEYVFRAVAQSECSGSGHPLCVTLGAPAAFATYPSVSGALPDGRGYELVSPVEKHGGEVFPAQPRVGSCLEECKPPGRQITALYPMQSALDGSSVAYMGFPFSSSEGSAVFNSYVSTSGAAGWQTAATSPPLLATRSAGNLAYNDQLTSDVILQPGTSPQLSPQAPAGYTNLYLQNVADPAPLIPLVAITPPHRSPSTFAIQYGGHSPDFSAQFFSANDALTSATSVAPAPPDPGSAGSDLYEWSNGNLALVNVLPGNTTTATGARFASASPDAHAVSQNGRRVFWEANGHLYVREDGEITRELAHVGTFVSASENGLTVLFADGCMYSLLTESCTDLTQGKGGFAGIAGASGDLLRTYFVDTAVLPGSGHNERQQEAQAGKPNLYIYEAGAGSHFIATLFPSDGAGGEGEVDLNDWGAVANQRTAEASRDGRFLTFGSTAELTDYGNVGLCHKTTNAKTELERIEAPCSEIFLYDSVTGRLVCASCNPTGEAPRGLSTLRRMTGVGALPWIPQPRYLTNQGRLFFDSQDRLSPLDTNGRVEDVYELEPDGAGSCGRPAGCVTLISRGTGGVDSNLLAVDESGANVFFTTRDRLVPADTDELLDLYDAREGAGTQPGAEIQPPACQGEACQAASVPPTIPPPTSQNFGGPGNVAPKKPPKCPKGKVRQGGKCVKKAHGKKQSHRATGRKAPTNHYRGAGK